MHNLAVLEMRFGNETAAFEWFLGGAENGHSQSMHTVSAMLLEGDDPDAALDWFRKAADAGDHVTCFELAEVLYARSEPNDDRVAAGYLRDAAERGYAPAQAMLGDLYHAGRGVSQSSTLACLWFRRAAADGHPIAQARLAQAYRDGDGVEPDTMEAAHWALRAEEQGNRDAQIPLIHVAPVKRTCSVRRAGNSRIGGNIVCHRSHVHKRCADYASRIVRGPVAGQASGSRETGGARTVGGGGTLSGRRFRRVNQRTSGRDRYGIATDRGRRGEPLTMSAFVFENIAF